MNYAAVPAAGPQVPTVFCIGTLDTKGPDLAYVVQEFSRNLSLFGPPAAGEKKVQVVAVDVSASSATDIAFEHPHITRGEVLSHHPDVSFRSTTALPSDRGAAVAVLTAALQQFLDEWQSKGLLVGALGIGGSGGTALIAPALRHLPIGLPKLLVSTVASSKSANYAEASDLVLWPSVVDIAGLNRVSKIILSNAAAAMAGMVAASAKRRDARKRERDDEATKPTVGLTMFGVTTPCVTVVQRKLEEAGFEPLLFHATGIGGQAMENMVAQGLVQGVIDITTTEVADHIVGGVMPCKSNRFVAMIEKMIPLVVSVGALDMVNFWEETSIPTSFTSCNRKFYVHNEKVTLMRTTPEENRMFARFIANALNKSTAPVTVLLPEHGVSALDAQGKPFDDPKARQALYDELEVMFHQTPTHQIQRRPFHINDIAFAEALVEEFVAIASDLLLGARKDYETSVELPLGAVPAPSLSREVEHTHGVDKNRLGLSLSWLGLEAPLRWRTPATEEAHLYRSQILQRLWAQISRGIPIIGAGAGTGISAKFEEEGGADLIIVYNSGRFRMAGRGSLAGLMPYKDANAVLVEMASEILPVVSSVPVLAGVCASDPFRQMHRFLPQLAEMGFAGVQNFPTVGLIDGNFRQNLEETGMGYGLEVDMIQEAHRLGLLTTPYAFTETEAQQMARAGADIIVAHMGLTTSGSIGAQTALSLETCAHRVQNIAAAAHEIRQDIIVLCHGGPISGPNEANYVLQNSGVHGFYGASSMERLPVEIAVTSTMREYKEIKLPQGVSL